jgi:hypothetical protein
MFLQFEKQILRWIEAAAIVCQPPASIKLEGEPVLDFFGPLVTLPELVAADSSGRRVV